jgi:hypothetical protein
MSILGQALNDYQDNIFPLRSWEALYKVHADVLPFLRRNGKGVQ